MADRVLPILRLAVLCEDVDDAGTERPVVLKFPVHTLYFPDGVSQNFRPDVLRLYLQLQGGRGGYFFKVVMRRVGDSAEVLVGLFDDQLDAVDEVYPLERDVPLNRLVFPEPDVYELLVYANAVNLHEPAETVPIPFPPIRVAVLPAAPGGDL
jgi:hypothetical protein